MTKEEAILVLDNARPQTKEIDRQFYDDEDLNNALDIAIKALEQQPSDDCVSRQATLDAIIKELCIKDESYLLQSEKAIYNVVKNMPPVTPTHKQGKWDKGYGYPDGAYWKCSCCNELIKVKIPMHFCSNCGADMRGDENVSS